MARFVYTNTLDDQALSTGLAYGISATQTLLLSLPYQWGFTEKSQFGDLSAMYRHIVWQQDSLSGTTRLGLLGGGAIPTDTDRDGALQSGLVLTRYSGRHEIDVDVIYLLGLGDRLDQGRYDVSWQYRLLPAVRPEWGIAAELNTVLELNGRWLQHWQTSHQMTAGLQWVQARFVIEGGISKPMDGDRNRQYILSIWFHF